MKNTIIAVLLFFLTACMDKNPKPPKTGFEGKSLPEVTFLLPDSTHFNTKDIPLGQTAVVFYFSTFCPYCRAQMQEMTENMDKLKGIHIYIVTLAKFKDFKNFYNDFNVKQYPNITAGLDYTDTIGRYFKLNGVPFTAIYNPQKKLSEAFHGRISVDQIKAAAN